MVHRHAPTFCRVDPVERRTHLPTRSVHDASLKRVGPPFIRASLLYLCRAEGGSRTGWQKQWFAHSNPFTTKVDFGREPVWPSPSHYSQKANLAFQRTKMTFPSWSMGSRPSKNPVLTQENHPSPDTYDTISAFRKLRATNTPITLKSRTGGTQLYAKSINGNITRSFTLPRSSLFL